MEAKRYKYFAQGHTGNCMSGGPDLGHLVARTKISLPSSCELLSVWKTKQVPFSEP